jgi:membrane fusion protein (multidrug efflux system)
MSCVTRVHNLEKSPQVLIPGKAVVEQMGEYFVYLAKDTVLHAGADSATAKSGGHKGDEADSTARKGPRLYAIQVRIETGQTIGSDILVKSGLHNGDKIVVDGVQALHDGSPITTANRQGPAAGGKGR